MLFLFSNFGWLGIVIICCEKHLEFYCFCCFHSNHMIFTYIYIVLASHLDALDPSLFFRLGDARPSFLELGSGVHPCGKRRITMNDLLIHWVFLGCGVSRCQKSKACPIFDDFSGESCLRKICWKVIKSLKIRILNV